METNLDHEWEGLLFDVRRSVRYHNRRRAWFDRLDQTTNVLSLIFGSTAIYGILSQANTNLAVLSAAIVTVFSAINLVVASSQRARAHFDFARKFFELEQKMILVSNVSKESVQAITAERLSIEKDEPPVLRVLDSICYNEQILSMDYPTDQMVVVGFWQRLLSPIMDFRASTLRKIKDVKSA
ncbi:hypothetical protein ACNZ7H_000750 [Escherichia coli]|uniref:hypothetical protein n=1 Tax=Enterobacter cloacae complex TaxID=354276 RepID=UPI00115DFF38|nr:hypothetical protein [Enterobacter hormaechei]EBS1537230.1 hypothetical protein [Salmonella enterica subsp. enterica serovar Emek]TRL69469.1 hypothetical protein FMV79_05635 [Enterobacter hormaechei]HBC7582054.1 hypothetical protein [Escherichia coli]HBL0733698.1 hypothetical protein [Kluyvera ascorbata]